MTERLTFDKAVQWMYPRTGHFTDGPSRTALLRMAAASVPAFRTLEWTTPHGDTATITYDAGDGFYRCKERSGAKDAARTQDPPYRWYNRDGHPTL